MSDPIGCEVCHGLTRDGYTLERYGNGFRCQSHIPRGEAVTVVKPAPTPVSLSCEGVHVDNPRACARVRCNLGNRCVEPTAAA